MTTATCVRCSGRITNGMRSGRTTPQDSIFIPDTGTHSPGMALPRIAWVWLNQTSSRSCLHKWSMASSVSVAQKNKPSTFNVLSIDLPTDCMAWWCWTMRQSNCCSTPALRSCVAMQWLEKLAQKKENEQRNWLTIKHKCFEEISSFTKK